MLYTPVPLEDVWRDSTPSGCEPSWGQVGGRLCLLRADPDGQVRVERLVSLNPGDYWDPRWQPGALVDRVP